ncbi:YqaE/Pmp3 family membrane protein [[Clostridium] innocuum]|jgi:uncharacterized membrane protein YqaE (UPF0057 family)|nr:YqaE/Pmp3 family membrane protein [[Clostridium] innocuum]
MYLLALLLPPVAVLLCGKPIQALLNLGLTFCLYVPGVIHAFAVVGEKKQDKRFKKLSKSARH